MTTSREKKQAYYLRNKEKFIARAQEWAKKNQEKRREIAKKYRDNNRAKVRKSARESAKRRRDFIQDRLNTKYKNDLQYRLAANLRSRVNVAIKNGYKAGSAVEDLGCTIDELKSHLESRFYTHPETGEEMSWENWSPGGWHIDHIKPLSSFDLTNREQFLVACNYKNLQPLWSIENIRKGGK